MKRFTVAIALSAALMVGGCSLFKQPLVPDEVVIMQRPAVKAAAESSTYFAENTEAFSDADVKAFAVANAKAWEAVNDAIMAE